MVHDFMLEKRDYIYKTVLKKSLGVSEYRKLTSYKSLFVEMSYDNNTINSINHIESAVNRLLPYTVGTDIF